MPGSLSSEAGKRITTSTPASAKSGAKQWFIDKPAAQQLFTLSIPDLETENNTLVDALFPSATAAHRTSN
jgi:hypothetical protein